jgi:hypothetical protein
VGSDKRTNTDILHPSVYGRYRQPREVTPVVSFKYNLNNGGSGNSKLRLEIDQ